MEAGAGSKVPSAHSSTVPGPIQSVRGGRSARRPAAPRHAARHVGWAAAGMRPDKDDVRRGAEGPLELVREEPLLMDVHRCADRAARILAYQTRGGSARRLLAGAK